MYVSFCSQEAEPEHTVHSVAPNTTKNQNSPIKTNNDNNSHTIQMALFNVPSSSLFKPQTFFSRIPSISSHNRISPLPFTLSCSTSKSSSPDVNDENTDKKRPNRRLSEQSSWEAKDAEGRDYLYRLGKEADNMNIAVGARDGIIDPLFAGNFLGRDCNIAFLFFFFVSNFL